MGDENVAWFVLNAGLGGQDVLDVTNLRPWALVKGKMLVLYGPAGTEGMIGINRSLVRIAVPADGKPLVAKHDHTTVVVLSTEQVDTAYVGEHGLYVGVRGLGAGNQPVAHPNYPAFTFITTDGKVTKHKLEPARRATAPKLGDWQAVSLRDYADGTSPRFATLPGPRSLEDCGADRGYGWYRVVVRSRRARRVNLLAPEAGHRLHLYVNGKLREVVGVGEGARGIMDPLPLHLSKGETELVFLADNLGRFSEGLGLDRPTGIWGHLLDVKPFKFGRTKVSDEQRVDPFVLSGYVPECSAEARGPYRRFGWDVNLGASPGLVLTLNGDRPRSVVMVNDRAVAIDPGGEEFTCVLRKELRKGKNRITFALLEREAENAKPYDPLKRLTAWQILEAVTEEAQWHYGRWQLPNAIAQPVGRAARGVPAFFRTTFALKQAAHPLRLEVGGGTKGQIYLNGHNLGRYWVASVDGRKVGGQRFLYLPEPWVKVEAENELTFFDEHGQAPTRSRLVYE